MAVLLQSVKGTLPIWEAAAVDTLLECIAKITFLDIWRARLKPAGDQRRDGWLPDLEPGSRIAR
jgi:hypothetical protein